jgi:hypothetical protein
MKKEAPENEASYFSHGLREAVFLFRLRHFREFASGPCKRLAAFRITAEVADALSKRRK